MLVHAEALSDETLSSQISCFGESSQLAQDLVRQHRRRTEAAVASRFLIEYVAAVPPSGQDRLTLETYDHLLAIAAELISRATLSDAIHHGFSESQLSLLKSGRLGVSRGDRYEAGTQALAAARAESLRKISLEPPRITPEKVSEPPSTDVETALLTEFGFTLMDLAHGVGEVIALGDDRCTEEPHTLPISEVIERLQSGLDWSQEKAEIFIDQLSLRPRANFLSVGVEAWPWRYNRDWSYVRRPFVTVQPHGKEPALIWGVRRLWSTGLYWIGLVYSGRMRGRSKPMRQLMGAIRQAQNKAFETLVEATLREGGCSITASGVSKVVGKKLKSAEGHDLGDIDALGISPAKKLIIVAEAKDFELARNPTELANEADDLLRGEKSAMRKLGRRAQWITDNLARILSHFDVNGNAAGWTVLPVIVTSRDLVSPRVLASTIPVIPAETLKAWVESEIKRCKRRRNEGYKRRKYR